MYRILPLMMCVLVASGMNAQDIDSLLNLNAYTEESDLQRILNKDVAVSSQGLSARETPGILSVITGEEIENSGARDLTDVLRLVPGFEILQDLQFVMGLGLRGNWANEGKVLVLLDGQQMNELLYQTVAVGNHFAVDAIDRIEIIRGPGSAIYGGSAEYGVINIITKAATLNGARVYGMGGFHGQVVGRTNGGLMFGSAPNENVSWDLSVFRGNGIVSDEKEFEDPIQGISAQDLSGTTADPMNISVGLRYNGLSIRSMYDQYETSDPSVSISYKNYFADVRYAWHVNEKLSITPQVRYANQIPWVYGPIDGDPDFKTRATRALGQLDANYTITRKSSLLFGVLYFQDKGIDLLDGGGFAGENTMTLSNYAVFAQGLFKHRLANATIGFRYEKNNRYGGAFVPRLALTKKIENLHFKVLYSQAFRAPSIQNINIALNGESKPEKSNVFEIELGYQFTPEMLLALNAFSITTRDVLIYGSEGEDDTFNEWYENYDQSGTSGIEVVYSIRKKRWYATITYSFNKASSGNTVDKYEVPQTAKQFVGFPSGKLTTNMNVSLTDKLTINGSLIYSGTRYAYTTLDQDDAPVSSSLDPYALVNLYVNYRGLLPGFTVGVGVFDLLNARPAIPQAYDGGYGLVPARSRELVLKLAYQIDFKSK